MTDTIQETTRNTPRRKAPMNHWGSPAALAAETSAVSILKKKSYKTADG